MPGESVLIVDDAPVNLKLADILLRKEGFRVQTARDAAEALSALGAFQPDLMLVSAQLSGMDGLDLARCVKADPATRHIVVVALTASASPEERARRRSDEGSDGVARRDRLDSTRTVSPLEVAEGARIVDTTDRPIDAVVEEVLGWL